MSNLGDTLGGVGEASVKAALNATGAAPVYGLRAWVKFDGDTSAVTGATYSRTGSTVTLNFSTVDPGLVVGNLIYFDAATGAATDETAVILTVGMSGSDYIATFTHTASGSTSGACNILRSDIIGSGNIHSVADLGGGSGGVYGLNYLVDMPNDNYAITPTGKFINDIASNYGFQYSWHDATVHGVQISSIYVGGLFADSVEICVLITG